jgi:hypothetical protein
LDFKLTVYRNPDLSMMQPCNQSLYSDEAGMIHPQATPGDKLPRSYSIVEIPLVKNELDKGRRADQAGSCSLLGRVLSAHSGFIPQRLAKEMTTPLDVLVRRRQTVVPLT